VSILGRRQLESVEDADAREVRERKIRAARANANWTELQEVDLVPRSRGRYVHAPSDAVYSHFAAASFDSAGRLSFNETLPLGYFISTDGEVVLLERDRRAWSEIVRMEMAAR
jgi:hypothetical protein